MNWYKIRLIVISTYWKRWKQRAVMTRFGLASMRGYIAMQHCWLHFSLLFFIQQRMSSNISHWLWAISNNNSFIISKKTPKRHTNAYRISLIRKSKHTCSPNLSITNVLYQTNVQVPPFKIVFWNLHGNSINIVKSSVIQKSRQQTTALLPF